MSESKLMSESKTLIPKTDPLVVASQARTPDDAKQRRLMAVALALLLVALGFVLYRDRDFWFPETQEAELDEPDVSTPVAGASAQPTTAAGKTAAPAAKSKRRSAAAAKAEAKTPAATTPATPVAATTNRTVLPPLEVEVVAGDTHRTIRPGTNSVRVDLQPGMPQQAASDAGTADTTAGVTSNASERVQMSAGTAEVVSRPVRPAYPLLARQMKVQGSVILQALIGKDGMIQDLRVLSGPPILATAAQDAVRQWHFKPHYLGADAVETQAKITVNFTISTN